MADHRSPPPAPAATPVSAARREARARRRREAQMASWAHTLLRAPSRRPPTARAA